MPDFTTYDATSLAQEGSFIQWVRKSDESAVRFWDDWLATHPERAEVVETARNMVERLNFAEVPPAPERVDALWARIGEAIDSPARAGGGSGSSARIRRRRWLGYAAAAVVLLLLAVQLRNTLIWEVVRTEADSQLVHTLPDGSVVELNTQTTLRYRPKGFLTDRMVKIDGEAFFYVEKGGAFEVETARGRVEVLGTTFNVDTKDGNFIVDCFTGRVGVSLKSGNAREELTAGRGVSLDAGRRELVAYDFIKEQKATWRQRNIYFEDVPLRQVFDDLEKVFEITVVAPPDIEQKSVKGFFTATGLTEALNNVAWPNELQFENRGDTIIFNRLPLQE